MKMSLGCGMFQSAKLSAEQRLEQKTRPKLSILSQWLQLVGEMRGRGGIPRKGHVRSV